MPRFPLTPMPPESTASRFRTALMLHNTGVAMMRQNLRRKYPQACEHEIDLRMADWLGHNGRDLRDTPHLVPRKPKRTSDAA